MGPDVPEGTSSMHKMLPHGLVSMDRVSALLTDPQEENPENSTQDVQIQPPPGPQELMDTDMQKRVSTSGLTSLPERPRKALGMQQCLNSGFFSL